MQREIPILSEVRKPHMAPAELVSQCHNRMDAIRLCAHLSGMSNETLCGELGIDAGHWSRIMHGRAHFPDAKSIQLMNLCGNYAPLQYEAMACGFELYENPTAKREAELVAELEALRARKTA